jgi:hypothetical protein
MSDDGDDESFDDDMPLPEIDFQTMKQAMEYEKQNTMNVARVKEGYSEFKNNISEEMGHTTELLKEMFTPQFMKRMQFKKKFPAKVSASEGYDTLFVHPFCMCSPTICVFFAAFLFSLQTVSETPLAKTLLCAMTSALFTRKENGS